MFTKLNPDRGEDLSYTIFFVDWQRQLAPPIFNAHRWVLLLLLQFYRGLLGLVCLIHSALWWPALFGLALSSLLRRKLFWGLPGDMKIADMPCLYLADS